MFDNNAVVYQGIQRVFRNSMVKFLRENMQRIFPNDSVHKVKHLFGESWDEAARNAASSRTLGGTNTSVRDDYDLMGVNHFAAIFDKYFDNIFSTQSGYPVQRARPVKTKFLGNLKGIKDGRDPLSHPVEEEMPYDEAFGLLIDAKQVLLAVGFEKEAGEISALSNELIGGPEKDSVLRYLPTQDSIYLDFVGRTRVLGQLDQCFRDSSSRRILLAGDGGKGKSAVAYRYAQSVAQAPGRFQLVVWLSAKRKKFQDGISVRIDNPDFTCTDDAVNCLLVNYGAVQQDLGKPILDKKGLLFDLLNDYPAFVVADDIDTLLDDPDVVSLFTHEIPHTQSSVLLTSRRDIPGIRSFPVKGFEADEAEAFIQSRMELYGLDKDQLTTGLVQEVVNATDGSPLYMDDLLRLGRVIDIKKAIQVWKEKRGDEARKYALPREMEQLSLDAKKVLTAAAISDGPVSSAELESILDFSEERLISALSELQSLFLFATPKIVQGEQRFEINVNSRKLVRSVEGNSDFYARIERSSRALRGQLPEAGQGVIGALIKQAQLRLNAQRSQDAESILVSAIEKYPQSSDLQSFLGYAYKRMGRIADARFRFNAAVKLKGKRKDTFIQWIKMEVAEKEWSKAVAVADKAAKSDRNGLEIVERRVFAERQAGFDYHRGLHREKAERMWRDAIEHAKQGINPPEVLGPGERQINSSLMCSMVICLDMLGESGERDRWFRLWESEHPDDPQVQRQREFLTNKYKGMFIGNGR